jgi:putative endonuclease
MKQEKATQSGVPWTLVWSTDKLSRSAAMILERKLKNLTRKRLIDFILKYSEGVGGPDEFLLLEKLSGC